MKFVEKTMPTAHLLISGKVQGVFYRASAKDVADQLQLTGWVRNTKEGEVEAMASGNQQQLQQFIDWCRQGPSKAIVKNVQVTFIEEEPFNKFTIIK